MSRVLINAVERYVRSIAEEARDMRATIIHHEQLLTSIDSGIKHSSELVLRLHGEQSQSIAQVENIVSVVGNEVKKQGFQARTQEQCKWFLVLL